MSQKGKYNQPDVPVVPGDEITAAAATLQNLSVFEFGSEDVKGEKVRQ